MDRPRLNPNGVVAIPVNHHPLFRTEIAIQRGVEKNLLFRTWGGAGDQVCAEPTLRYAMNKFPSCKISLAIERPEFFTHLKFDRVYDLNKEKPDYDKYLLFDTITPPDDSNMVWLFFSHLLTNCVDFPSMCALRMQLPVADREIHLPGEIPLAITQDLPPAMSLAINRGVYVHAGRHWQSKTFPKSFWDRVLAGLLSNGITPVLIGGSLDDNRGTVDVNTEGCLDLRGRLTFSESIGLLKQASVLLTNDSAPMHMAASGDAYIGFIATCKHPDMLHHWRKGQWAWREKNFGKGGIWEHIDFCPNQGKTIEVENVDPDLLASWLPNPYEMSNWAADMREKRRYED